MPTPNPATNSRNICRLFWELPSKYRRVSIKLADQCLKTKCSIAKLKHPCVAFWLQILHSVTKLFFLSRWLCSILYNSPGSVQLRKEILQCKSRFICDVAQNKWKYPMNGDLQFNTFFLRTNRTQFIVSRVTISCPTQSRKILKQWAMVLLLSSCSW